MSERNPRGRSKSVAWEDRDSVDYAGTEGSSPTSVIDPRFEEFLGNEGRQSRYGRSRLISGGRFRWRCVLTNYVGKWGSSRSVQTKEGEQRLGACRGDDGGRVKVVSWSGRLGSLRTFENGKRAEKKQAGGCLVLWLYCPARGR